MRVKVIRIALILFYNTMQLVWITRSLCDLVTLLVLALDGRLLVFTPVSHRLHVMFSLFLISRCYFTSLRNALGERANRARVIVFSPIISPCFTFFGGESGRFVELVWTVS